MRTVLFKVYPAAPARDTLLKSSNRIAPHKNHICVIYCKKTIFTASIIMKILLSLLMTLTVLPGQAQQSDTLYIYDLFTDGDYTPRYSGDKLGGTMIHFSFGGNAGVSAAVNTKLSGIRTRKLIAKKAWMAGIMIIKPLNKPIKIFIKGKAIQEGNFGRKRTIPVNDTLVVDTVRQGLQYYAPKYHWKSPLLAPDYADSVSYVNQGTYFHDCFKRRKKRMRLLPLLQPAIVWQYDSESGKLINMKPQ
jgi:hypothetical protein